MSEAVYVPQGNRIVPPTAQVPTPEHVVRSQQTIPDPRQGDVTVILYSGGASSHLLSQQLEALRRQTVSPAAVWCHVDGVHNHDEKTLSRLTVCRTTVKVGRYFRLELARSVATRWVAVLDEDTIPGPRWLEHAINTLESGHRDITAREGEEPEFGPGVIAAAGSTVVDPSLQQALRQTGPEMPREDQELVSFGRQGWVFHPEFARLASAMPRAGIGPTAFAMAMGAAAWNMALPTLVLPYGMDRADWGAVERSGLPEPSETDALAQYRLLQTYGWDPSRDPNQPPPAEDDEFHAGSPAAKKVVVDPAPVAEEQASGEQDPEAPEALPGVDLNSGWTEKRGSAATTREKVLTPEEAAALEGNGG